jgi:MFS superfamily sulfate permease-like transporter
VFTTTVLVTVTTDLLWGIAAGIIAKLLQEAVIVARVEQGGSAGRESVVQMVKSRLGETGELFRNPVVKSVTVGNTHHMFLGRPLVCFNSMYLESELARIPNSASAVCLHVTDLVTLIDHATTRILLEFVENFERAGRGVAKIAGLDRLRPRSHADSAMRISRPILAEERARYLDELTRVSLTHTTTGAPDPVAFMERISLTHPTPIPERKSTWYTLPSLDSGPFSHASPRPLGIPCEARGFEKTRWATRNVIWSGVA